MHEKLMHEKVNEHVVLTDKHDISPNNPQSDEILEARFDKSFMTRVAETPMPKRRGGLGDKGVRWREA